MKNIFKEFKNMLSSKGSDKFSSKRVITFLAFMLVTLAFLTNLIFGVIVDQNMFDGIIQIVWAGLGVVVSEHLLTKRPENLSQQPIEEEEGKENEDFGDN